jgi:predicted enzyme related to lactoylglutathione lyase
MHLTGVSPVLLVADLDRSVAYYGERLGFECEVYGEPPNFAAVNRDEVTILLALAPESANLVPHWQIVENMWNVYIRVDDADAAYAEVQDRGAPIDYTIYDAPHGFREFGVQDPDGHDIAFGQPLNE